MSKLKLFVMLTAGVCVSASLTAFAVKTDPVRAASSGPPNVSLLQAAYDWEATPGNAKHDKDVKIVEAHCFGKSGVYRCFVTYINKRDQDRRLYFDVAEVVGVGGNWTLKSGICKRA